MKSDFMQKQKKIRQIAIESAKNSRQVGITNNGSYAFNKVSAENFIMLTSSIWIQGQSSHHPMAVTKTHTANFYKPGKVSINQSNEKDNPYRRTTGPTGMSFGNQNYQASY